MLYKYTYKIFIIYFILFFLNIFETFTHIYDKNEIFGLIPPNNKTYFILASKTLRPGQVYRLTATFFQIEKVHIRTSIKRFNTEIVSVSEDVYNELPISLHLKVPATALAGDYKLRIEINSKDIKRGATVVNETPLNFSQRSMTIFIVTDRPIYKQGQIVKFRCVPITTSLRSFSDSLDIFMRDPNGYLIKRWLSKQSNLGAVTLEYPLSEQPVYGKWKIEVIAQNQIEIKEFLVEEYYPTRFEVNVSMPTYFRSDEKYVYGDVVANFTSGIPVIGNLTLFVYLQPIHYSSKFFMDKYLIKKNFKFFSGFMKFNFSLNEIKQSINGRSIENTKLTIKALVGDRFLNIIFAGHSSTLIYSSQIKLKFIGSSPRMFKPHMPLKVYCSLVYENGFTLDISKIKNKNLTITFKVFNTLHSEIYHSINVTLSQQFEGIWEILINLRNYMITNDKLNDVKALKIDATYFIEESGISITSYLNLFTSYTENKRFIQIDTTTVDPKVGEYMIFHVRTNYQTDLIYYVVVSKGIILYNNYEKITSDSKTISIVLSSEMVPISSIVIYYLSYDGHVISDSLTFHVNGISRNSFTIDLNEKKDKLGDTIEVIIKGEPGTYVGLSALDQQLSSLDTESYFNYNYIRKKMGSFEEIDKLEMFTHQWISKDGIVTNFRNFPLFSLGIDSNETFENAGLNVFTDAIIIKRPDSCNKTIGLISCLNGNGCYEKKKRCNRHSDCADNSDESNCPDDNLKKILKFHIQKNSRISKSYENSWLWKDINIGPLGYYIFKISLPDIHTTWIINAFAMNNKNGFCIIKKPIIYSFIKKFLMNIEIPSICIIGEQISVRVNLFNLMQDEIEVLVILPKSSDYKFVHVEEHGYVSTYNPRTSFGEHQHLVLIKPSQTLLVYIPIVLQRLGTIQVCILVKTQASQYNKCKNITVEADGVPQYLHTSVVIDLSQGAQLFKYLDTNITDTPIIPFQRERRYVFGSNKVSVSVVGDVVGPAFPFLPMTSKNLLRKPDAAAEQNMFNFAYNLDMLLYMRSIDQRNYEMERQGFKHLNIMFQKQLSYQNKDGSFRMFRWYNTSSVWLTAFCARILHKATFQEWENYIYIDKSIIERAVSWILKHQTNEGSFYEPYIQPYNRKINLNYIPNYYINQKIQNISLTAHVVIALSQIRDLSGEIGSKVATARYIGTKYLESILNLLVDNNNLYDLAIVTYALTLVNSVSSEDGFNMLEEKVREVRGMRYWNKAPVDPPKAHSENNRPYLLPRDLSQYDSLSIETTAYVLHVYLLKQASNTQDIVDWLNTYRLHDNGWCSTQDSLIALEALIEYSVKSRLRDITNIDVNIEAPSSTNFSIDLKINQNNIVQLNKIKIPKAYGPIIVKVSGSGLALVQLDIQYNVDWPHLQIEPPVPSFNLEVLMKSYGRNASHIQFESCQSWKNLEESRKSGMAVLDITIPTGYLIQQQDLDEQVRSGLVPNLREAKFSERKIQFYFDYLDQNEVCLKFTIQRWYPVANLTRYIYARIYDFYAPERFNETIINAYNLYVLSICHVCGSYQCPYCPYYSGNNILKPNLSLLLFLVTIFMLKKIIK